MKAVFADAFYFVACLNRADQHHEKAVFFASRSPQSIVTTTWILTEVADAFAASIARDKIAGFVAALEGDVATKIVPATQSLFHRGLERYAARPDKSWTLTDCISFIVMEDEGITEALTGDHHFSQAGFEPLLK
jgi:predicted nucleic acid-binding protein